MSVNTWGRGRSAKRVIHIRKDGAKGLYAETMCGRMTHNLVNPANHAVADCKRCVKVFAEMVKIADEITAEVIAEERKG